MPFAPLEDGESAGPCRAESSSATVVGFFSPAVRWAAVGRLRWTPAQHLVSTDTDARSVQLAWMADAETASASLAPETPTVQTPAVRVRTHVAPGTMPTRGTCESEYGVTPDQWRDVWEGVRSPDRA